MWAEAEDGRDMARGLVDDTIWAFPADDHLLLMRPGAEHLFLLNPSASVVWEALSCEGSEAACAEALAETFGIPRDIAQRDAAATLAGWRSTGLLRDLDESPPLPYAPGRLQEGLQFPFSGQYCLGSLVFSIATDSEVLYQDLSPRVAHLSISPPVMGGVHYAVRVHAFGWLVYRNGELLDHTESSYAARVVVLHDVMRSAYAGQDWSANLHAAVIGDTRRCVVLAGASGAGKSTLSVAARVAGLDCLGDDSAPILRDSGNVAAVPLAVMLREGSWGLFESLDMHGRLSEIHMRETGRVRFLPPADVAAPRSLSPAALLFLARAPGASPYLEPLGFAARLALLAESGFWVRPEREHVLSWLDWLRDLPCHRMHYDTTGEGVALLRQALAQ